MFLRKKLVLKHRDQSLFSADFETLCLMCCIISRVTKMFWNINKVNQWMCNFILQNFDPI